MAWKTLGCRKVGAGGMVTGTRRRRAPRVMTLRNRRRLRRWVGCVLVTVGAIGLVHADVPGVVPLLVGVALLQMGSGRARRLLRRVDDWWQGACRAMRERTFFLGPLTALLTLAEETLAGEGGFLTRCCALSL